MATKAAAQKAGTTRSTKKSKVTKNKDGTLTYGPYDKKNNAGKPTDRKISVHYNPKDQSTSSQHTAKVSLNKKRVSEGKRPIPKQAPGKGTQVAHKQDNRTGTSASGVRAESAKKNIGDGNASRR